MKEKTSAPWIPADYTIAEAAAIQALLEGVAEEHQQQLALKWIIETLCGTYDMSFHPEGDRETAFAEGKRFAGSQIVKLTRLNVSKLRSNENE